MQKLDFAVVGDIHLSDENPSLRVDDYLETILGKLLFIITECNKIDLDFILFLGDIFNAKKPWKNSYAMVNRLSSVLKTSTVPIYSVVGNHDYDMSKNDFSLIEDVLYKYPIGMLEEAGALTMLRSSRVFKIKDDYILRGLPYSTNFDKYNSYLDTVEFDNSKFNIFCMHQMILPDKETFPADYSTFSQYANLGFDMMPVGHYHPGFTRVEKIQSLNNKCLSPFKYFVNPGSISRGSISSADLDKKPVFSIITIDNLKVNSVDISIPIEDINIVFDLEKKDSVSVRNADITSFVASINEAISDTKTYDLATTEGIIAIMRGMNVDSEVVSYSKRFLGD